MHYIDHTKRTIGVTINENIAHILVWAPYADTMEVLLNDQTTIPLLKQEYGYWYNKTSQLKTGDCYEFLINGKKKLAGSCFLITAPRCPRRFIGS
jgi:maltooligosyltrehalose trehalohydrolase